MKMRLAQFAPQSTRQGLSLLPQSLFDNTIRTPYDIAVSRNMGKQISQRRIDAIGDHQALDVALRALSDEYRLPVVLRDVADLDYAEIALVLDLPPGTVRSRIARGRAALAKALSAQPGNQPTDPERPSRAP